MRHGSVCVCVCLHGSTEAFYYQGCCLLKVWVNTLNESFIFKAICPNQSLTNSLQKGKKQIALVGFQWDVTGSYQAGLPNYQTMPSLQWTDWFCCGELLHSELVATADLLRRVHAPWPSTGHAISSCLACGRLYCKL